jgi:hypothetical protein
MSLNSSEEVKQYVQAQLARAEKMIPSERSGAWHDRQLELFKLWIAAEQAESLATIAKNMEAWRVSGLPVEVIGGVH